MYVCTYVQFAYFLLPSLLADLVARGREGSWLLHRVSPFDFPCSFRNVGYSSSFHTISVLYHSWHIPNAVARFTVLRFVQTNSPTLARQWDGIGYIRIYATPPRRLVFWDGVSSPYKWYQSHALNLLRGLNSRYESYFKYFFSWSILYILCSGY